MTTEKPKVQKSYVTATDPDTRKSVSFTIYGATPEQVKERMVKAIEQAARSGGKRPADAAA